MLKVIPDLTLIEYVVTWRFSYSDAILSPDSGHGEYDDSRQVLKLEQPSLNTTKHLIREISSSDLVIHVGDLSYADGYEAGVSTSKET